jgi:hypothetical protein
MIVLFEQPRIISPGPQYVAFEGLTTNLPLEGDQWLIIRSLYTNTVIEAGRCPPGTQNALINATDLAGKTVSAIAYGLGNTGTLFYANGVTIDPSVPLRLTAAVGPAPEFTPTRVAGKVQIDGTPAERTVRAFGYNATAHAIDGETVSQSKSLGQSTSDPTTGAYTIDLLAGYGSDVFVVAFDDYGDPFTPEQALTVGDRIHPTTPNGHVLECTGAGSLPAEEPSWTVDTETSQLYGTASMIARPFYRPMVHGPIAPDVNDTLIAWTPEMATTNFWFDPSDAGSLTEDVSGNAESLSDKSGNGLVLSQATAGNRPRIATQNGLKVLDSVGGSYTMQTTGDVNTQGGDILLSMVVEAGASAVSGLYEVMLQISEFFDFSVTSYTKTSQQRLRVTVGNGDTANSGGSYTYLNSGVPFHLLTVHAKKNDGIYVSINGAPYDAKLDSGLDPSATIGKLMLFFGTNFSNLAYWEGQMGELFMENTPLDLSGVQIREGYLAHKWGLAESLPVNHPYKEAPPVVEPIPEWSPAELFQNSEVGIWLDPSDLTTMFKDEQGSVPVTADGDPVGLLLDKSGNGNHAFAELDHRPIYRTDGTLHWLEFDRVSGQYLKAPQIIYGLQDRCIFYVTEPFSLGSVSSPRPAFDLTEEPSGGTGSDFTPTHESDGVYLRVSGNSFWPVSLVTNAIYRFVMEWDYTNGARTSDDAVLTIDGVIEPIGSGAVATLNTAQTTNMLIGHSNRQNDSHFEGKMFEFVALRRTTTEQQKQDMEDYLIAKLAG